MTSLTTETDKWIQGLCSRFSDATGWQMVYTPRPSKTHSETSRSEAADCWSAEISNEETVLGHLHFDLPDNPVDDRSFSSVCHLGDVLSEVLNRLATADQSLESRSREVSTLVDIGRTIPNEADLITALDQLLRAAVQLTGFRSTAFFLLNPSTSHLSLRVTHHLDLLDVPHPVRDLSKDPPDLRALAGLSTLLRRDESASKAAWLPEEASTALCLAVGSEAGPIGTLWVFDRRLRSPSDRETHVLESIASQIAAVLERAVLLRESVEQHRQQRHLEIASENQYRDILGPLGADIGFDAAAVCASAYELGGDLCELIRLDANKTVVAVGDASGDSVPAAMVMSAVRGSLRTLSEYTGDVDLSTDEVMRRINKTLHSITPAHQFMSLLYGVLDTARQTFTYTNAGHPTPLLVHNLAHNGNMSTLESHGMLLGVLKDAEYTSSCIALTEGDLLIIFSDGISEAMNRRRKMFRSDGIYGAVKGRSFKSADEVLQSIWSTLETHTADGSEPDDRTLLVIKIPD